MEIMALLVLLVVVLLVLFKLNLFRPVVQLAEVAEREAAVYNREHKARVATRYQGLTTDIEVDKVNAAIAKIDALDFD